MSKEEKQLLEYFKDELFEARINGDKDLEEQCIEAIKEIESGEQEWGRG